ncbi:MAG: zf-TFIIB domain-containing protein [Deltaproteobacteria bacterium]|nr:zf-TFIIB domain-containing protein [Deltaproteobacteria bacterium]
MWVDEEKIKQLKSKVEDGDVRWMDDELEAIEKTKAMASDRLCPKCNGTKLLSTKFGHSNLIIDWCPSCHGIWLDRDEFLNMIKYLDDEENHMTTDEMRHEEGEEIKKIWTGHEHKLTEIVDAWKAHKALSLINLWENHPEMARFLLKAGEQSQKSGF